jgi:multiple sugar transport system permease protein
MVEDTARIEHASPDVPAHRRAIAGRALRWASWAILVGSLLFVSLGGAGYLPIGEVRWQAALYGTIVWAVGLCVAQVLQFGEGGKRSLFILPAALFVVAVSTFPLIFAIIIAFSNWNLSSPDGRSFNGLANLRQLIADPFYWNALLNMVFYCAAIVVEYAIAFGLALLLTINLRGRKFFRVAFLLPLMLSPVAVSWLVGKSMLEPRFGPIARAIRYFTGETPSFFGTDALARATMMIMDAWMFIPLMMIMLLAGLQSVPEEIHEAAKVDGASAWRRFWEITFPLMLPVSITTILIRLIFKLKLGDIIINVTAGGPGGATDTVTSFIYREYRDRSNVGYGSMLAIAYLVIIIIGLTLFIKLTQKWATPRY